MNAEEPNLLTHINEVRKKHSPEGGVSTFIICGKMRAESDANTVLDIHRRIVEEEVKREKSNISGICMVQGVTILHLLEGPCSALLRILTSLVDSEHFTSDPPVQTARVIYTVEDRPRRYFPEWYSCAIPERKSQVDDVSEETCVYVVNEMASKLLEVGSGLQSRSDPSGELEQYADLLPGKNLINSLANSLLFFTVEEFIEVFVEPSHLVLESESTWPLERLVSY